MPNFKKSDGFSLGGNPFTMKKGSKEITTDGSFRKEATDKMGGYGSPLFAIVGRDPRAAGAAYRDTSSDMAEDVDNAQAESKAVKDGKKEDTVKETTSDLENSDNTPKVPKTAEAGDGEGGKDILEKGKEVGKKVVKKIAGIAGLGG
tara:strand:+ start:2930 stop:3370 length:441 start_codon:yes stop_codon:yes gene_type:complete